MTTPSNKSVKIISPPSDFQFAREWYKLATEDHFWFQWRLKIFLGQLKRVAISAGPLKGVDIGCGNGTLRAQIEKHTPWAMDGFDLDIEGLKESLSGRGDSYLYDVLEQNKNFYGSYDLVILFDILEHIEAPLPFLKACLFHLKKGGHLFINVPAMPSLASPYDKAAGHVRRYTSESLLKEFNIPGIKILDIQYWGFSMLPILFLRKFCFSRNDSQSQIIRKGFAPPHVAIDALLKGLMKLETRVIPRPFWGTSLMAVAQKE